MTPIVRAIDIGFGNTKYVAAADEGKIDCAHFPSLAFHSARDKSNDLIGGRRRTVAIPLDDMFYEVGPDVELAATRFRARQLHDNYVDTREYRALACGALHYMKQETIDLLVVGLPVAQFLARRSSLERASTGDFDVGRKRKVTVKRTLVLPQPQGALLHYAATHGRVKEILDERSLVIDAGWRTFDWLVTRGLQVVIRMSHSTNRGVSDILRDIAEHIGADIGVSFTDLEAIDVALRTGKNPRIFQKTYDIKPLEKIAREVADQAVSTMVQYFDNSHAFENIILVGGGAFIFKRAVKQAFPRHTIHEVREPLYANVRGFQLMGQRVAAELQRPPA